MSVQNTVRKSFECAAMNVDFILIKSAFLHIIQMFSLVLSFTRVWRAHGVHCTQTWNVCRTISIFVIDAGCWLIRYNNHRKNQLTSESIGANGRKKTKSHTQIYPIKSTICTALREFNFRFFSKRILPFIRFVFFSRRNWMWSNGLVESVKNWYFFWHIRTLITGQWIGKLG